MPEYGFVVPVGENKKFAGFKKCVKCGDVLPVAKFHKHAKTLDGHNSYCKICTKKINAEWYKKNTERRNAKTNAWAAKNRDHIWAYGLQRDYGMTRSDYNKKLNEQNGVCAICLGVGLPGKRLCVDHDHKTGAIRGILCHQCNAGIGHFKDDIEKMEMAMSYLKKYNTEAKCLVS